MDRKNKNNRLIFKIPRAPVHNDRSVLNAQIDERAAALPHRGELRSKSATQPAAASLTTPHPGPPPPQTWSLPFSASVDVSPLTHQ